MNRLLCVGPAPHDHTSAACIVRIASHGEIATNTGDESLLQAAFPPPPDFTLRRTPFMLGLP
ncbi:hypothetical protein [Caballeronia catudaia]|uniref:hypothetical protein n=1 Tax=Caballeronia catudaia TaxID=1777136 RepID=UPI00117CE919|nr:hypothetical protein [Caballeronia catudaia]